MTADPASRVAAILEPLRPYAEEIVIAADARVEEATLAQYAAVADRLFRIEFRFPERHMAWLHAQCRGDWILRLDGDEVPSEAFVRRLPSMLASNRVHQFWTPTAWLCPDRDHLLAELPWSTGFVNRLVRNDCTLRFSGTFHMHAQPATPCEYIEEPFYHLELLSSTERERRDKVVRYEVTRPHLRAAGGGRLNEAFYLPELRDGLKLRVVPEEDRERIARALASPPMSATQASVRDVPFVSAQEMDRLWEGRSVDEGAYRASIESWEPPTRLTPGEHLHLYFRVRNEGTETWPAQLDANPAIRLSYRWLDTHAEIVTSEAARSAFSRPVHPGESLLTPVHVEAPPTVGDYVLEVDLVHEHVRWFDSACRVSMRVAYPAGMPAVGERLRADSLPSIGRRRLRRMRIPRTIHRVWIGPQPLPAEHERFGATFERHNPGWEMRLWTEGDLTELGIGRVERERARTCSELSNVMRYQILSRHGGVYVDTDVECPRALTPLLRGIDAFAALELTGRVGDAVLGSVPGHPAFVRAAKLARQTVGVGAHPTDANGPYFLSLILEQERSVTIFDAHLFHS